jgi:sortase B
MTKWWKNLQQRGCKWGERFRLPLLPLIPLVIVFLVSAAMLTRHYIRAAEERRQLAELAALAASPESTPSPAPDSTMTLPASTPGSTPPAAQTPEPQVMLASYRALYEQNPDMVGWIKIDGTRIDYPVMYTQDDFYLTHGFDKGESKSGVPFIDKRCTVDPFGTNTIIYGHHMKNGTMFADLENYKDEAFYREHPVIQFDTLYQRQTYEIVAVFESQIYRKSDTVFKHYNFLNAADQADFDAYMENIKSLALYDTGVTASYGDEILTLVTCAYHTEYGQFVVVAKKTAE